MLQRLWSPNREERDVGGGKKKEGWKVGLWLSTLKDTFSHVGTFVFRLVSLKSDFHFCASLNPAKVAREQ